MYLEVLADRRPGPVSAAAGDAARGLRASINVNGVGKGTAIAASLLIGRTRDNRAVTAGIGIFPGNRGARLTAIKRIHLRRIGALFVFVVERSTDAIANQTAEDTPDCRTGNAISGPV